MSDKSQTTIQPLTAADIKIYLGRALAILSAFAGESMAIDGEEDPGDFVMEVAGRLAIDTEDYDVNAMIRALKELPHAG